MTTDNAEIKKDKFDATLKALNPPRSEKYVEAKNKLLGNTKNFYEVREKNIEGFREGIFPLKSDDEFGENMKKVLQTKLRRQRLDKIQRKEQNINNKLFKNYFTDYQSLSNRYKELIETENAKINKTKVDSAKKYIK